MVPPTRLIDPMQQAPNGFVFWLRGTLAVVLCSAVFVACYDGPPSGELRIGPPPKKPGASITGTKMCTCTACEPESCCVEDDGEQPETADCANSYDFTNCGNAMTISSCESRCFRHRWRASTETDCEAERPDKCCAASDRL